jgi:rSAM/selenodomain-associated transferase 1
MLNSPQNLLLIFIKNPLPGKVKTRLAKDIGEEEAVLVYKKLLSITHQEALGVNAERWICYGDFINQEDIWTEDSFKKKLQSGKNLGERIKPFFEVGFSKGFKRIVIIGSDCPEINAHGLNGAFDKLKTSDAVIGPANDGGYYLVGLSKNVNLFENKTWSTESVFDETVADFKSYDLSYQILEEKVDLDTFEDLKKFPNL